MEEEKLVIKLENIKQETVDDELTVSDYHITENQFHNSNDFVCNTCHKTFCVPSSSRERKLEIECPFCFEGSSSSIKKQANQSRKKEKKQRCNICSKTFYKKSMLKRHLNIHEKPFECDLCCYRASRKECLLLHMKIHGASSSKNRRSTLKDKIVFQCNICQKCFESKYKIIQHIQFNHSDLCKLCKDVEIDEFTEEPDCCMKCLTKIRDKFFKVNRSECYQLKCKYCFKFFNDKKCLKSHERMTHLENKKFYCDKCAYEGKTRKHLTDHNRYSHR